MTCAQKRLKIYLRGRSIFIWREIHSYYTLDSVSLWGTCVNDWKFWQSVELSGADHVHHEWRMVQRGITDGHGIAIVDVPTEHKKLRFEALQCLRISNESPCSCSHRLINKIYSLVSFLSFFLFILTTNHILAKENSKNWPENSEMKVLPGSLEHFTERLDVFRSLRKVNLRTPLTLYV